MHKKEFSATDQKEISVGGGRVVVISLIHSISSHPIGTVSNIYFNIIFPSALLSPNSIASGFSG
jgi:hypothetical protein